MMEANEQSLELGRANVADKKPGLPKSKSTQILDAHAVEEDMLKELKFAKCIVKQPCLLCWSIIILLFIIGYIDSTVYGLTENSSRGFFVEGDEYVDAYDAYELAAQYVADNSGANSTDILPQTEANDYWLYQIFFKLKTYKNDLDVDNPDATDYWILTPENIEIIIGYEDKIYRDQEWRNQFCYVDDPLNTNFSCAPALNSVARQIAEQYDYDYDSMTTEAIKDYVIINIANFSYFFNPGVSETEQTYLYRSFIKAGAPIATEYETFNGTTIHYTDYLSTDDELSEQEQTYIDWATDFFVEITVDNDADLVDGELEIVAVSWIDREYLPNVELTPKNDDDNVTFDLSSSVTAIICYL